MPKGPDVSLLGAELCRMTLLMMPNEPRDSNASLQFDSSPPQGPSSDLDNHSHGRDSTLDPLDGQWCSTNWRRLQSSLRLVTLLGAPPKEFT